MPYLPYVCWAEAGGVRPPLHAYAFAFWHGLTATEEDKLTAHWPSAAIKSRTRPTHGARARARARARATEQRQRRPKKTGPVSPHSPDQLCPAERTPQLEGSKPGKRLSVCLAGCRNLSLNHFAFLRPPRLGLQSEILIDVSSCNPERSNTHSVHGAAPAPFLSIGTSHSHTRAQRLSLALAFDHTRDGQQDCI